MLLIDTIECSIIDWLRKHLTSILYFYVYVAILIRLLYQKFCKKLEIEKGNLEKSIKLKNVFNKVKSRDLIYSSYILQTYVAEHTVW